MNAKMNTEMNYVNAAKVQEIIYSNPELVKGVIVQIGGYLNLATKCVAVSQRTVEQLDELRFQRDKHLMRAVRGIVKMNSVNKCINKYVNVKAPTDADYPVFVKLADEMWQTLWSLADKEGSNMRELKDTFGSRK